MHRDWESYLDGTLPEWQMKELEEELLESAAAREELAKVKELDGLMATAHEAFRLACPSVENMGVVVSGKRDATDKELAHFGHCEDCQKELKEIAKFQQEVVEKNQSAVYRFTQKGQWLIESLKRGMAQILDPAFLEPALAHAQPAFAHEPETSTLPGLWVDASVKGLFISIEQGYLKLGGQNCEEQVLIVKITKEEGEAIQKFVAKAGIQIPLEGVWHVEVNGVSAHHGASQ